MGPYAGIDVTLEYSSVCVVDASGKVRPVRPRWERNRRH